MYRGGFREGSRESEPPPPPILSFQTCMKPQHSNIHRCNSRGGGDEGGWSSQNLAGWDTVAFIPLKIYSYRETLMRSRFCERPTEMCF